MEIIVTILSAILIAVLITLLVFLIFLLAMDYSLFCCKVYTYITDRDSYRAYKQCLHNKPIVFYSFEDWHSAEEHGEIPQGAYVFPCYFRHYSIWKDDKVALSSFYAKLIEDIERVHEIKTFKTT